MAIVPVERFTIYGPLSEKVSVLEDLQDLGCMHLIALSENGADDIPLRHASPDAVAALHFLKSSPERSRPATNDEEFDFDQVLSETLAVRGQLEDLRAERDELNVAAEGLLPWGNFRLPAEGEFGKLQLWFYVVPLFRLDALQNLPVAWEIVSKDHRFAYVAVLSEAPPSELDFGQVELDPRPLAEIQQRLEVVESNLEDLHWRRVRLTKWIHQFSRTLGIAQDRAAREQAAQQTWDADFMFALQGWAPASQRGQLSDFARNKGLAITVEPAGEEDCPPTLLSNRGLAAGGESAVKFYTTPAYDSWDPSGVVFLSFSIFFAMIMADAGYALLLAVLLAIFWRRLGGSSKNLRLRRLFTAIAVASIIYGIAVGSYFGLSPPPGSWLARLQLFDATDTALMMRLSIIVGVVHLVIANCARAWSRRWSPVMLSSFGWCCALLGGLAWGFGSSGTQPAQQLTSYGSGALVVGLLMVLFFSSEQPWFTWSIKSHGKRLLDGVLSLTNVSRAFGDVLSYLRLFALGLASAQLATTFNKLSYEASSNIGIGSLLAVLIVVLGHGLNFALAILSGVVHGLRLNCIEFFGWSLPDEGYPFQPFAKRYL